MFEPENDLEHSLMKAATDPTHRPQFYRDVLTSEVYLVHAGDEPLDIEDGVLQEGTYLQLQPLEHNGQEWLPIFSSLSRLQEVLQSEATYLQLSARAFFEITRGANVILNPGLDYGKEFTAPEIERMLDGSIFHAGRGYTVEKETQVLIGQPAVYPTELANALSRLFARYKSVRAAYLAHFFNPERDDRPHTLIGIDADEDWEAIVGDAGMVARAVLPQDEVVDFLRVSPDESGVSQYMLQETKPFYKRPVFQRWFR